MNSTITETSTLGSPSRIPRVPWGWLDILAAIVVGILGIILLNLLAIGASYLLRIPLRDNKDALIGFLVLQDLIVVGAAWLFSVARYRVGWDRLGLRPFPVAAGCGLSVGLLLLSYIVRLIYSVIVMAMGVKITEQEVLTRLDMQGIGFLLTLVAAGIVAPIAEEIFFRGFVYGGLRSRIGVIGAMLMSTLFFTALHMNLQLFIPIFALGLFLAWLYEYSGSLLPGIFLHAANNLVSLLLFFLLTSMGLFPSGT